MRVGTIRLVAIAAGLSGLGLVAVGARAEDYGPFKEQKTSAGNVLADAKGMTLYTYDKDKSGESACTGKCADVWPPAKASASDKANGDFTIIKRPDGTCSGPRGQAALHLPGRQEGRRGQRRRQGRRLARRQGRLAGRGRGHTRSG